MKSLALIAALAMPGFTALAANDDTRVFEMRTYHVAPGKMEALHARFRDHTCRLFEKHGITNVGYWTPVDKTDARVIFVLAYPSREERETRWKAFATDPDWVAAKKASETDGELVKKADQLFLKTTDYSPEVKPSAPGAPRVFELRTYTCVDDKLKALDSRFRDHTCGLFAKHGMTNLFYWHPTGDQAEAKNTLVYFLAHKSVEAGKASFDAFRKDPVWIAAKGASEKAGGGSLTVAKDGVKSLLLAPTDYSPTK